MDTTEVGKEQADKSLAHFGVKGMKWGRRRSRAELARASAQKDDGKDDSPEHTRSRELATVAANKGIRKLSNKELQDLTQRLNLEQQFTRLMTPPENKTAGKGKKWVAGKLISYSNMAMDEVVKGQIKDQLKKQGLVPK